jgi:hypothetical protein
MLSNALIDVKNLAGVKEVVAGWDVLVPKVHLGTKFGVQAQIGHTMHRFQAKLGNESGKVSWCPGGKPVPPGFC